MVSLKLVALPGLAITGSSFVSGQNLKQQYVNWVANATGTLNQLWYNHTSGLWHNYWWQSGCILTTIGNVALLNQSLFASSMEQYIANTFAEAPKHNTLGHDFYDGWYDDEGWWALGLIKAYDLTSNTTYLNTAVSLWQDMLGGLNATCGGHWWNKPGTERGGQSNNAIGNDMWLTVSAALGNRFPKNASTYLNYAEAEAQFMLNSDFITPDWILQDGLDLTTCKGNNVTFSYDMGQFIGGLVELAQLSKNTTYLDVAAKIANGTITKLADPHNGILTEPHYPQPEAGFGGESFKGVFMRNLMYLNDARPSSYWRSFLQNNANEIWNYDRAANGSFGDLYQGPLQNLTGAAQGSAIDALVAAAWVTTS